jgi:hypothetical protein
MNSFSRAATKVKLKKVEEQADTFEDAIALLDDDMKTEIENLKSDDHESRLVNIRSESKCVIVIQKYCQMRSNGEVGATSY